MCDDLGALTTVQEGHSELAEDNLIENLEDCKSDLK